MTIHAPSSAVGAVQRSRLGSCVQEPVRGVVYAHAARAGRGDLGAWTEGGVLTYNGEPVALSWPRRLTGDCTMFISHDAGRNSAANRGLVAPARFRIVPGVAFHLALAVVGEGVAAASLCGAVA